MVKLRIEGGKRLKGSVKIAGAKNAALPALCAPLLTDQKVTLSNLPQVRDCRTMLQVLEQLGAQVGDDSPAGTAVQFHKIGSFEAPYDLVKTMRASILTLGPLLARHGRARVSLPGGCAIGARPINFHLEGLAAMGAELEMQHGYVEAKAKRLKGASYAFPQKSVTGTENLMMAACLADGTTILRNCAHEPEIVDLAVLLTEMGGQVEGAGGDEIRITGRESLGGAQHRVMPDRIEAGTYLVAAALVGDGVEIVDCEASALRPVIEQLRATGITIETRENGLFVPATERIEARDLRTAPHPGYPTDMQAQYMAMMTQAHGTSVITESVFERRFMHVSELQRLGADIRIDGHTCVVVGPAPLTGAQVMATDLRASASLVLAALAADGPTVIDRVYHLDRGYEAMECKLQALGASVERIR